MLNGVSAQKVGVTTLNRGPEKGSAMHVFWLQWRDPSPSKDMPTFCCKATWEAHVEVVVVVRSFFGFMAMLHMSVEDQGAPLILRKTLSGPATGSHSLHVNATVFCMRAKGGGRSTKWSIAQPGLLAP